MTTWFCLASGPSMCREDAEAVRGKGTVIAINTTIRLAPWADILYSCDAAWWREYSKELHEFRGERLTIDPMGRRYGCRVEPKENGEGLGTRAIRTGCNSGYQAVNLAFLRGAETIVLLGYDMQHDNGRAHWHDDHPKPLGNFASGMPEMCRRKFAPLAADLKRHNVRVINATRRTALTCFERMPLAEALRQVGPA